MRKIVFYNKTLISGGIEKCLEILNQYLDSNYDIEIVYTDDSILDINIVNILKQHAKIYKIEENMHIKCNLCVWCYLYFDYEKLKNIIIADKYIAWIHSMPRILPDCQLDNPKFILDCSRFICVSEAVKNNLNIAKESEVIHNFVPTNIFELAEESNPFAKFKDYLKLVTVSRLSSGKGFGRLQLLCESLIKRNIKFKLIIVGKGRKKEQEIKNLFTEFADVFFVGYQENPYQYIKNADYLLQLSDDESWCNSITEAKVLGVPVIATNFESAKEQIEDSKNGIIVRLDEINFDELIDKMLKLNNTLKSELKKFEYNNEIDKWLKILENK